MSIDSTVRALLEDATPTLRAALREGTIEALVGDLSGALRDLVRHAYEAGYREGLTGAGGGGAAASAPATAVAGGTAETPAETPAARAAGQSPEDGGASRSPSVSWERDGSDAGDDDTASRRATPSLRIFPHATVGTLHERIVETFDLGRFQIDVVLCRKGDSSRRQLKHSVKLSTYLDEGA